MELTSRRFRDQPNHPLQTAIYWVEYVARHQGASHLQSSGRLLGFWAANNLDVYAIWGGVLVAVTILIKMAWQTVRSRFKKAILKQKAT